MGLFLIQILFQNIQLILKPILLIISNAEARNMTEPMLSSLKTLPKSSQLELFILDVFSQVLNLRLSLLPIVTVFGLSIKSFLIKFKKSLVLCSEAALDFEELIS